MDHDFYLCQPGPLLNSLPSCASCCGIYNYQGHDRELVSRTLELQTELMKSWDGTDEDIERIRFQAERSRPAVRFEVIYNCPFAGFLDDARTLVGCLLHPLFLGRDLREFCRYGRRTCGEARCSAYTYLNPGEARAVMAAAGDWYLYGLCITDIDLVKDFFELCEGRLYRPVSPERVAQEPALARAFGRYLALKEDWPFATDPGRFGKYFFEGKNYHIYLIDYARLGISAPAYNGILLSLGSVFERAEELTAALSMIDEKVESFVELYSREADQPLLRTGSVKS